MLVFCMVSAMLFQVLALANLRRGFYIYLASLPLLPAYIAIPLVKGGAGLSLNRMMTYGLFLAMLVAILRNTEMWLQKIRQIGEWPGFIFWLAVLFMAKLISTATNQEAVALVYWLDELIGVIVVFILAVRYVTDIETLRRLLSILLVILFVQLMVVLFESLSMRPIFQGIVEIQVSTVGDVSEGFERAGSYRAVGLFDNPLSLAEYLLIGVTMLLGAHRLNKGRHSFAFIAGFAFIMAGLYFTAARFSVVVLFVAIFVAVLFNYSNRIAGYGRFVTYMLTACILSFFGFVAYLAITDVNWFIDILNTYSGEDEKGTASVVSRASQYILIPSEIFGNSSYGIVGEGIRSQLIERLDVRLDNYFLRVLIEGGVLGMIAFIALLAIALRHAISSVRYSKQSLGSANNVRFFLILFFVLFSLNKLFLSMSYNNQYFFLFAGIALSLSTREKYFGVNRGRIAYSPRS
jgi:hypothetical protein